MLVLRSAISREVPVVSRDSPQVTAVRQSVSNQSARPEWIVLTAYAALVYWAIRFHEPWADEAQAWQLARSLPLGTLFRQYIRYEGTPGLWHFLLWVLNRAHVSYSALHWLCGLVAISSIALLLFKSPFPRYLKLSLPFTYFLVFQYAVVARSYVLVPGSLFLIAIWWKKSPMVMALLLGLLSNVSAHAAAIAFGLTLVFAFERLRRDRRDSEKRKQLLLAALVVALFVAVASWTAWPPQDLTLDRVRGTERSFSAFAIVSLVWGICEPWPLSIAFWAGITACLHQRKKLLYLLPVCVFAVFSGQVFAAFWHVGMLVPLVISILWMTWPAEPKKKEPREAAGRAALLGLVVTQLIWAAFALAFDHYQAYSPDFATAKYLQPIIERSGPVAVTFINDRVGNQAFDAVGLLPYFPHNIFLNQSHGFWWWSNLNDTEARYPAALASHPRVVLVEVRPLNRESLFDPRDRKIEELNHAGYSFQQAFCGERPERLQLKAVNCHLIFAADPAPTAK
jgi:hypothetical protein